MSWASWPTHYNWSFPSENLGLSPGGSLCISKHVLIVAYWSLDVSVFIAFLFLPDISLSLYFSEHTPYCRVTTRLNNLLLFWGLHFYTSDLGTPPVTNRNVFFSSICSTHQNGEHRHFRLRSTAVQNAMDRDTTGRVCVPFSGRWM